jgi:hypothetical protein
MRSAIHCTFLTRFVASTTQILRTPLHWACTQKNEAVMEFLILAGADLTIKNNVSAHFAAISTHKTSQGRTGPSRALVVALAGRHAGARLLPEQRPEGQIRCHRAQEDR